VLNWQDRLNPQAGGAEAHLHEVFGRLARQGMDVTLLTSGWRGAPPRDRVDGMEIHRAGGRYSYNIAAPLYYRRALAPGRFDVVVEDLNKVPLFAPYWCDRPLVLLVHHLFGRVAFEEAAFPLAAATWLLERPLGRVYRDVPAQAVSQSTAQDLMARGFDPDSIEVIPNGVDLSFYSPAGEADRFAEPTLLYLGRLKRYKRVDLVVRTVARLRDRGTAVRLVIAGTGDRADELRRLVAELDLTGQVEMPGFVSDEEKRRLFRGAWIHMLTSPKEGWGITNIEAAACGTPTIASESPGLRDSVVDGRTGFLVPHGDVDALADRAYLLISEVERRRSMGAAARVFAEQFSWDEAAARTAVHLERVVGLGSRP
jgi:glycosyltransferase involved in cell wall biosynthesis